MRIKEKPSIPAVELSASGKKKVFELLNEKPLTVADLCSITGFSQTHVRNALIRFEENGLITTIPAGLVQDFVRRGRPSTYYCSHTVATALSKPESIEEVVVPRKEFAIGPYAGQLSEFFEGLLNRDAILRGVHSRLTGIIASVLRQSVVPSGDLTPVKTDLLALSDYFKSLADFCDQMIADPDIWGKFGADFKLLSPHDRADLLQRIESHALKYDAYLDNVRLQSLIEDDSDGS